MARGRKSSLIIQLSTERRTELGAWQRRTTLSAGLARRARMVLLRADGYSLAQIAREVGVVVRVVVKWLQRYRQHGLHGLGDKYRTGAPRHFTSLVRAQITALACSNPSTHGKAFKRWSGEKLAQVATEQKIVETISASAIRRWLKEEKIKPWRYHSWQKSQDPQFVEKASLVLDLYEHAVELATQEEAVCCVDEKPSIQARQRVDTTLAAKPGQPMRVAYLYERRGALQLFCALMVTTGMTLTDCYAGKTFSDFKHFLLKLFASVYCRSLKVLRLILDNGPTHSPKKLEGWIASLELPFDVRVYWLPTSASWLNQAEIIFSKVQRDVLTPNDFGSTTKLHKALIEYFDEMNQDPKPVQWTYTKAKMLMKFG